uniref:Protein GAMETE EXPRESSED 3 n=1 Tax=Tarenaya spinosa TaxID=228870 RepID=Q1KUS7_9ROSI|nr:hypothetical protein [Tarenaya spinosa]
MATSWFCLLLSFFIFSAFAQFPDQTAYKDSVRVLSKPLVGDDGRIYACSENDFFSFEANGSIAWSVHLNFKCDHASAPVRSGTGQILVLAENRILIIDFNRNGTSSNQSESEVFFDPGETILGFAVSSSSSSVYFTVKNRGLYAYNMLQQQQLWIAEPKFERFGYRLGCRRDFQDCSFTSPPVIDACEASIYISNNQGELYSLSIHAPHFQWIQDLSLVDRFFAVTPGNNGLVYVVFPVKSLVLALDSFSGNIQWQKNVGPLASSGCGPVIDSNGWVSIGSLDGSIYSFSRTGKLKKFPRHTDADSVIQVDPLLDCSGNAIYVSQTKMEGKVDRVIGEYTYVSAKKPKNAVFTLLVPETGSVYWSQSYPDKISSLLSEKDLQHFVLDERIVLAFLAASRKERGIIWFILFEFVTIVLLSGLVRFCCVFWKKKKIQEQPLRSFLRKRVMTSLACTPSNMKKKGIGRTITELEMEGSSGDVDEVTEITGRDEGRTNSEIQGSVLPFYDDDDADSDGVTSIDDDNDEDDDDEDGDDDDDDDDDVWYVPTSSKSKNLKRRALSSTN